MTALDDHTVVEGGEEPVVRLVRWDGPWPEDDPDANLKVDVASYAELDPLSTLRTLSSGTGIPVGALVRYIVARWASGGSEGLLALGPDTVGRLRAVVDDADRADDDAGRLAVYERLGEMVRWLDAGR
jgi:hypothetical protein